MAPRTTSSPRPVENPNRGSRQLLTRTANPEASPFGWHDTDGVPGAEFTTTQGNNALATVDDDLDGLPDPGSSPDGGSALHFDFPLDLGQQPETFRSAALTNLFYWANTFHDIAYAYGFDEASGNFQVNNYGKGGVGGDELLIFGQHVSIPAPAFGFLIPAEGLNPRFRIFRLAHPLPNFLTVGSGGAAGQYRTAGSQFGPRVAESGPIFTDLTLVDDGTGPSATDACEPLQGFPAGDIALVDRGTCAFIPKVLNAQAAGASAVVLVNSVPGMPFRLGGFSDQVTIPSSMISLTDGTLLKSHLPLAATLSADPDRILDHDGSLDNGMVVHELAHGISIRLTGGAQQEACLDNDEQMGEGWSDLWHLALTARPSDRPSTPRGISSYLFHADPDSAPARPSAYSTDMAIGPATYASVADVANISQPHGVGWAWNSMTWEMYWNLVDRYGWNSDLYEDFSTGGNNLALQLVTDGMKFQPCSPGFVDGRDAILTADTVLTGGANQCEIWRGFAKRGLGYSADQGSPLDRTDGVEAFDLPPSCLTADFGGFRFPVANPPALNRRRAGSFVFLRFRLSGVSPPLVVDSQEVDCTTLEPTGEAPQAVDQRWLFFRHGDRFFLPWRTDRDWGGSCRRVTLRIPAEEDAVAYFRFR